MTQPRDALDLRRAGEGVILDALAAGHPLALAEAYHRSVPAAHAVARRLMSGADEVEAVLLGVYTRLWAEPPTSGPLEGWVRRTTWDVGTERLRRDGTAPSSPSAAGLLPDLPAPDVRFLDAAERAIAELGDHERHALLQAHDRGIPSTEQQDGAAAALTHALVSLAGPETSTADRASLHEDGCDDLPGMGDWCLGLAAPDVAAETTAAIDERPGCAAKSRTVRRGRRRIEGLPATPDMGQRILVMVLTSSGRASPPPAPTAAPPAEPSVPADPAAEVEADAPIDGPIGAGLPPVADAATAGELLADRAEVDARQGREAVADDPFDSLEPTGPLPRIDDPVRPPVPESGPESSVEEPSVEDDDDPFRPLGDESADTGEPVVDTADLPQQGGEGEPAAGDVDWRPDPGSTAELRLSDILAEGDDEDDPFAGFDDEPEPAAPTGPRDPYADLQDLDGQPPATPAEQPAPVVIDDQGGAYQDEGLVGGYVEGQEHYDDADADARPNRTAALLSWVLPILGGSLLGVLIAIGVFGLP